MLENAAMKVGAEVIWTDTQNNLIHAETHLKADADAAASLTQGGNPVEVLAFMGFPRHSGDPKGGVSMLSSSGGAAALLADHMSESVISAAPDWSLEQAAEEMVQRGIRHLVIVDRGELVGVLSMRDIVRCWTQVGATSSMSPP